MGVGPAKHRWALRDRLPNQNRLPTHAEESWCFNLLAAGAESPAGRALMVGAVERFRLLAKQRWALG